MCLGCLVATTFLCHPGPVIDADFEAQMAKIKETWRRGDYEEAQRLAQHALELARSEGHPFDLIQALHEAGQATLRLGQFDNARKNFTEELELSRVSKTTDPNRMATALADLAEASNARWDYQDGLKTLQESEPLCDQGSSEGPVLAARIHRDQGEAEIGLGEFEKAEGPIQAALEGFKSVGDYQEILATQSDLAELKLSLRKMDEAEALFKSVLEQRKASLGEEHPETATSQALLGYYHYVRGNYAAAEPLFLTAINTLTTVLGADNPAVLWATNYEGMLKIRTGQYIEAQSILQKVLEGGLKSSVLFRTLVNYSFRLRDLCVLPVLNSVS
jgi:tetratricopeptide (TPR) repeat protein